MNEQSIFLASLEILDRAERHAYVLKACAGDDGLRRQVESLLAAHEQSGAFLDVPVLEQIGARASQPVGDIMALDTNTQGEGNVAEPEFRPSPYDTQAEPNDEKDEDALNFLEASTRPDSLGKLAHYEVLEILGKGGFGTVVRAFDEKLQRVVAIKIMSPQMAATSPPRKRFLREARASAKIRHENVVAIHDIQEQPIPYLVMDFIPGGTLQQKLDRVGPFGVMEALRIGQQIAAGLAAAHAEGLIHRDIKPSNILLEGADVQRVKITDFGLARAADDASLTQSGMIAGTPMYMAPEQAQGITLDYRADLFSFGSVLYVMCSGRPPFRASTTLAVLKRVAEDAPRPIREIIPEVPQWLCDVIAKLHAKNPEDRFGSAQEVADLLGRYLAEMQLHGKVSEPLVISGQQEVKNEPLTPVSKPGVETATMPRPTARRRRRWVPAAAALLLLALIGLGLTEATGVTNLVQGTIIRLFSSEGTLVVEVDDPDVSVTIDGEEIVIKGAGSKEIRVKPGTYKVQASKEGKVVRQELVTVTKDGRQVVRISREIEPIAKGESRPAVKKGPPIPVSTDPDRRAAEWVLSIGGGINIKGNDKERLILAAGELPRGPFELTVVVFRHNPKVSDAGLAYFKDCKNLTHLDLHNVELSDAGLQNFKGCKDLAYLNLGVTRVGDEGLSHFKDCQNLAHLELCDSQVSDDGLAHFKNCKNLTYLDLRATQVSDAALAHFKDCKNLARLDLGFTRATDAGLAHFKDCKNLTYLDLRFTQVSDAGLAHFKDCKNITYLDLYGVHKVSDVGLAHFKDCKNLTLLDLGSTRVTDAGLAYFKECKNLTRLHLVVTRVSDAGLVHFKDCKNLEWLFLGGSQVSDEGLAHFKDCKNLTRLRLGVTRVSDAGLAYFKDCKNLAHLDLPETRVSDVGLAYFKDCENLAHLDLGGTATSDASLAKLASLPNLTSLNVNDARISLRGHEQLKAAMPKCTITWSEVNRNVAESVLALGGTVEIGLPGETKTRPIKAAADLPRGYFQVRRVSLVGVAKPLTHLPGQVSWLRFPEFDRLETLDLSGIAGLDYGFLAPIHGLEELSLAKAGLNDDGLAKLPKLPTLKRLVLDGNEIRGTGLTHMSGRPELIDLSLGCPTLGDLFAKNLTELKQVKRLSLAGSGLTDVGIKHLSGLTNLEALDLRRTRATEKGIGELKKALPRCKIAWDGGTI